MGHYFLRRILFKGFWITSIFLISVFSSSRVNAQEAVGNPFITNYTPVQTGNLGQVWSVIQGDNGVMYFGVQGGSGAQGTIEEYDGVNWHMISNTQNRQNIVGTTRCLAKDSEGTIYYGGLGDFGYLSHDSVGQTVCISLLKYVPENKRNFTDVWSVQVVGNRIYYQSRERLFCLIKSKLGNKITWKCKTWEPKSEFMYTFYLNHILYVHEAGVGLLTMTGDSLHLIPGSEFLGKGRLQMMLPYTDSSGMKEYLLGTFNQGLYLFNGSTFTPFHTQVDKWLKIGTLYKGIKMDGDYALDILGVGVVMMDRNGNILQVIDQKAGLASTSLFALWVDKGNNLWMAADNGISKISLNFPFTRYVNQGGLSSTVISMAKMPDGSLYIGTGNGLAKYNPKTSSFDHIPQIPASQIFSMIPDGNELLVAATSLYVVNGDKIDLVHSAFKDNSELSFLLLSKTYPGILYASGVLGLSVFKKDKTSPGGWKYLGVVPGIKGNTNASQNILSEQSDGSLWVNVFPNMYRVTFSFGKNGLPDLPKSSIKEFSIGKEFQHSMTAVSFKNNIYFLQDSSAYIYDKSHDRFVKHPEILASGDTMMEGY
ncbi:MAG: hypothetical protein ACRDE2_01370, partial [Chitinophagaceae bacterium]